MTAYSARRPVVVVTGFLGSGKTTLLNRLLRDPALADSAVLVNEFGEIGLDHQLIETVDGNTVLLASGCVCCSIRDDLKQAVLDLETRRARGAIPPFARIVLETTGLADPGPVIATFLHDIELRHHYRLALVVATVDAVNGLATLARHEEAVRQVAAADRLVVTKTDIASGADCTRLHARLAALNPSAERLTAIGGALDVQRLLDGDVYASADRAAEAARWLGAAAASRDAHEHGDDAVRAFTVAVERPLDWTAFGIWLTLLLHTHGDRVLRVKGLLNVADADTPVVINGVQHLVHPPVHLPRWPDHDRRSRIVFIVRGLAPRDIEASLAVFAALGQRLAA